MLKSENPAINLLTGSLAYLNALRYFFFFWVAANYRQTVIKAIPQNVALVLVFVLAFAVLQFANYANDVLLIDALLSILAAVCAVLLMLCFSEWVASLQNKITEILSYIGKNTIPLYVVQIPIFVIIASVIQNIVGSDFEHAGYFVFPLAAAVTVICLTVGLFSRTAALKTLFHRPAFVTICLKPAR